MTDPTAESEPPTPTDDEVREGWLADLERLDLAVYAAIARTPTPSLDRAMGEVSRAADYSKLTLAAATAIGLVGGRRGRRAAFSGLASVAVTAAVINIPLKLAVRRRRPDRLAAEVPVARHVRMPVSRSFPSGHSAAAFAFATGVGEFGRLPRSRSARSRPWSLTRVCTPASTIRATRSPVRWRGSRLRNWSHA